jgi:hypothetical protein
LDPFSSGRWPAWRHWRIQNWGDEVLRQIRFDGSRFDEEFGVLINRLLEVAKSFVMEMSNAPTLPIKADGCSPDGFPDVS